MPTYPKQKSLTIGGRTFDASEIARFESGTTGVILIVRMNTASAWSSARALNASAGVFYTVPSGKTLTVKAIQGLMGAGGQQSLNLAYGDVSRNDNVADGTMVFLGGDSTANFQLAGTNGTAGQLVMNFQVPATKYIHTNSPANAVGCMLFCFLD